MERLSDHDELKDAPRLRSIPKVDPFVVPSGFFETFPHAAQERVRGSDRSIVSEPLRGAWVRPALLFGTLSLLVGLFLLRPSGKHTEHMVSVGQDWSENDLLHTGIDPELLYTELDTTMDLMDVVELPEDGAAVLAYLEGEDLSLDLLIEEL